MKKYILLFMFLLFDLQICLAEGLTLESSAFKMNTMIPDQYTCTGSGESPPLNWNDAPSKTQSFALIVDDPDSPQGLWTHWVVFNIPSKIKELEAGSPTPEGAINGKNSWGGLGYRGPCPPVGVHTYHFKLYALDTEILLGEGTSRNLLENAMKGHILGSSELIGLYQNIKF